MNRNEELASSMGYYVDKDGFAFSKNKRRVGTRSIKPYYYLGIRINKSKIIKVYIHRLQAYQKYGNGIYINGIVVRHLNGNSLDNSISNIEIGTVSQNQMDIPSSIRIKSSLIAGRAYCKSKKRMSDELVLRIRKDHNDGLSYKCLMSKYNISSLGTISFAIKKRIILLQNTNI